MDTKKCSTFRQLRPAAILLFLSAVFVLSALPMTAQAQNAATLQAFEKDTHLGSVEDAVVGVTVVNRGADGNVQVRHSSGVMLRCDGFVLAPEALFYTGNGKNDGERKPNQSVTVTLHPGTAKQQTVVGRRPGWLGWVEWGNTRQHLGYAVLKLDNVHCPALRALTPYTLAAGDKLTLAWSAWDEHQQKFLPVQTRSVAIEERKPPAKDDTTPLLYREQFTPLRSPQEGVTAGAVLLTEENLLVGIVPGSAPASVTNFANFASLGNATNCVTALPNGDVAFINRNKPTGDTPALVGRSVPSVPQLSGVPLVSGAKGGQQPVKVSLAEKQQRDVAASAPDMVAVPGGPVKLPSALVNMQLDMEASQTACLAPFLIDRFEVTNAQYWTFWQSLPEKTRHDPNVRADMYPYGWDKEPEPFPNSLAQVPVLGVRLPGARAYAKWAGKRLPTPYEWCLAAFGPSGGNAMPEWGKRFLKQRKDVWNEILKAHIAYARQHPDIISKFVAGYLFGNFFEQVPDEALPDAPRLLKGSSLMIVQDKNHPSATEFFHLPWFFHDIGYQEASAWSKQIVEDLTEPLFQEWVDPMYVLPVGSRPYDVSPYGALDMLTNASELVAPGPIFPWNRPPNAGWPVREVDRYMEVKWGIFDTTTRAVIANQHWNVDAMAISSVFKNDTFQLITDPDKTMVLFPFLENPLHLWSATLGDITAGDGRPEEYVETATSLYNGIGPRANSIVWILNDMLPKYTDHMSTRRLKSASENARPNAPDFVPSDLASFVKARAALDEYAEMLRPANEMTLSLQAGPTYDLVYYPFTGTTLHNWVLEADPVVERLANGRFKVSYPNPARWVDKSIFMDGTWITHVAAFPLWNEKPRHYHQEMGHAVAEDHNRPYRSVNPPKESKLAPDTFLVAGGFRCAR